MIQAKRPTVDHLLEASRQKLVEVFGYPDFREGQLRALRALYEGRDALVIMPTGSGKSLCYQIPALVLDGVTVVVSPLIALMKDQVDALCLRGIPATSINSTIDLEEQLDRIEGLRTGRYKIVYVAPERFRCRSFRDGLRDLEIALLAVDEAHCISQWGHDFRPDYRKLRSLREMLGDVPVIALTATATPPVQEDIASELGIQSGERVVTGFDRPNLRLEVIRSTGRGQKLEALRQVLLEVVTREEGIPSGILYVGTRKQAEELADALNGMEWPFRGSSAGDPAGVHGPLCLPYHAGLEPGARHDAQEHFMDGQVPWIAATNAFGMGVDKSDSRFVIHYQVPGSLEAYYQEVGRAGRDGRPARCTLLYSEHDRKLQEFFIEGSNPDRGTLHAVYEFLYSVGENPIYRTLAALEQSFQAWGRSPSSNPLVFRSSIAILERAGALERLDHFENLAEVSLRSSLPGAAPSADDWEPYGARAPVKHRVWSALSRLFERGGGEPARVQLRTWARSLELDEEALRRAFAQIAEDGRIEYLPPFRGRAIRLPKAPLDLDGGDVDFESLIERRKRDEERLESMVAFARSRSCRRDSILLHFGEPVPPGGCGRCDACEPAEGRRAVEVACEGVALEVVRKALSGVARARGRCGRRRIAQMLRGSMSQGVKSLGFDRLSTHGILGGWSSQTLDALLDALEAAGAVRTTGGAYPSMVLTPIGVEVLKGTCGISLSFSAGAARALRDGARRADTSGGHDAAGESRSAGAGGRRGAGSPGRSVAGGDGNGEGDGEDYDEDLFVKLRKLRGSIARELAVPAYRIFNDRTLRAMASRIPRSPEGLLEVPGVGAVTLERFGERFLEVLRGHGGQ